MPTRVPLAVTILCTLLSLPACDTGNAKLGLLGKPAPSVSIPGASLASLRGRPVVLNFWASWCAPCLEEFPSLEQLQKGMPGLTVLAVSFDKDPQAYARFLSLHPFQLRTTLDTTGRSSTAFGVTGPPETYILDSHGVVRRKFVGAQDWNDPEIRSFLQALE